MENKEIQNKIEDLINKIGLNITSLEIEEVIGKDNTKCIWFKLNLNDPYLLINKGGEGLLSFNHIIKRIVENNNINENNEENTEKKYEIMIDINDFQKKKIENIKAIAHMMAERSRYFKSNIEMDPMSAFERRIVHEFLSDATDLKSESDGYGPNRRVTIKYTGNI